MAPDEDMDMDLVADRLVLLSLPVRATKLLINLVPCDCFKPTRLLRLTLSLQVLVSIDLLVHLLPLQELLERRNVGQ